MSADYNDDRRGMMRIHVASMRADIACRLYTQTALRAHARARGVTARYSLKSDLAWEMAQHGLIDQYGRLRDGFPS